MATADVLLQLQCFRQCDGLPQKAAQHEHVEGCRLLSRGQLAVPCGGTCGQHAVTGMNHVQAQNVLEQRLSESQAVSRKDKSIIAEMGAHAAVLAAKTRQLEDVKLGLESRLQEAASQLQGADTLASDLHKQIKARWT